MAKEKKGCSGQIKVKKISRRDFIKTAGVGLVASGVGPCVIIPGRANASKKQLRIVQWKHKDPLFDDWFNLYAKEWGERNDTEVEVENHR